MLKSGIRSFASVLLAAFAFTACGEPGGMTSPEGASELVSIVEETSSPRFIQCPVNVTRSVSGVIGSLGGSLSLDGTTFVVPEGAVPGPTNFRLTLPASRFMEVEIVAEGHTGYTFGLPALVSIDYGRCSRTNIFRSALNVWHVDTETKAPLENMGAVDNKLLRTVTFTTGHLSTYMVAE